jgi:hypothetical protein
MACTILVMLLSLLAQVGCNSDKIYYISASGDDRNAGTSKNSPWKSIHNILPGSTYLLKRGEIHYFSINSVGSILKKKILINTYGNGPRPIISLYRCVRNDAWVKAKKNIWSVNINNPSNYTGYQEAFDSNIGFVKVDGQIWGAKVNCIDSVKTTGNFFADNMSLYIFSETNPGNCFKSIQFTINKDIMKLSSNMEVRDVVMMGTGAHAISGNSCKNVHLRNIKILEIGGSYLNGYRNGKVRYGNGIQLWGNSKDCIIENCSVSNVYDAAYTMQCTQPNTVFENITFKNNTANNNEQSFEFWIKDSNSSFKNCKFINSKCYNAGFGWSHSVRPDKNVGVHLLCYFTDADLGGLLITNNTFSNAMSGYIYLPNGQNAPVRFISNNNKIYLRSDVPISMTNNSFTINSNNLFRKQFSMETTSIFKKIK